MHNEEALTHICNIINALDKKDRVIILEKIDLQYCLCGRDLDNDNEDFCYHCSPDGN